MKNATKIQRTIRSQIDKLHYTIRDVERLAGLKRGAVSNILEGKTKKPSLDTLRAIAKILNCSLSDLLEIDELEARNQLQVGAEVTSTVLNLPVNLPLLHESIDAVAASFKAIDYDPNLDQFWTCVRRVYTYTLGSSENIIDHKFVEWLIKQYKE